VRVPGIIVGGGGGFSVVAEVRISSSRDEGEMATITDSAIRIASALVARVETTDS